jgi:Coenzyme PQQ synthesis protein D (PqqD)
VKFFRLFFAINYGDISFIELPKSIWFLYYIVRLFRIGNFLNIMTTTLLLNDTTRITARPDQISSDLEGETILLHMTSGLYYGLNDVGVKIWTLIQMPQTLAELRQTLLNDYDVTAEDCDRELKELLISLKAADLISFD